MLRSGWTRQWEMEEELARAASVSSKDGAGGECKGREEIGREYSSSFSISVMCEGYAITAVLAVA